MSFADFPARRLWNTVLNAGDKLLARDTVAARPLRVHIEVNDLCNLKCPHCPRENPAIPKNTGHIPFEAIKRLEPWFKTASYVGLTGNGEPFLHPEIMQILELVIRCGATPSVISNATLWKRLGVVDKLAGMGPMLLNVSIDGGTKATFEKWRLKANYEEVRANLRELREARDRVGSPFPITTFNVCLMKDNINEVEDIVDWGAEAGVAVINFQNLYPYVAGLDGERVRDIEQCREAIARARTRAAQFGIRIDWLPMSFDIDERDATEGGSYGQWTAADVEERILKRDEGRGTRAEKSRDEGRGTRDEKAEGGRLKAEEKTNGVNGSGENGHGVEEEAATPDSRFPIPDSLSSRTTHHAPHTTSFHCDNVWNQIHVTVKGEIKFCCFWTEGAVGDLLKDDFGDLWNGPEWVKLRRDLLDGKKPKPCVGCHNLVERDKSKLLRSSLGEMRDLVKR